MRGSRRLCSVLGFRGGLASRGILREIRQSKKRQHRCERRKYPGIFFHDRLFPREPTYSFLVQRRPCPSAEKRRVDVRNRVCSFVASPREQEVNLGKTAGPQRETDGKTMLPRT